MKKILGFVVLAVLLAVSPAPAAEKIRVFVSILPQKYFLEQVGGERISVSVLVEKDRDPHVFEPLPSQMSALAGAQAYFSIGLPFEESLLSRIRDLNPRIRIFRTDQGIGRIPGDGESPLDSHSGEGGDPHVWNSPPQAERIARNILEGLLQMDPEGRQAFEKGYESFVSRLDKMDGEFRALFRDMQGSAFLVYHPAWGYLARDYGLEEMTIERDGKEPKAADMARIISRAREKGVKVIFLSPRSSGKSAETIARALGARVERADPLAEEWEANIRSVAEAIARAAR